MFSAARWSSRARPLVLLFVTCALAGNPALAATVPPGFSETLVVGGLADPTAMQFAPDGRLFVCEQRGTLRVIKNGVLLPAPFVTLTARSDGERGLLGVAFDPAFAVNQYVYVYYTATTPTIHNRISRFTASGDVAVPGSEFVLMDLPDLSVATNHNGGALNFGPDGKLYASVGENNVLANSQSLDTTLGKMLRLNTDGSIPPDNPFFSVTTGQNRAIWALGLRNPFTFAFDPGGTRMFINDVGELSWEEINEGIAGANYGWPATEGYTTAAGITSPRYAYDHATGCAITGGAFYSPLTRQFPPAYSGHYFFSDICGFWIKTFDPVSNTVTPFATGAIYIVDLKVANNGDLYYLDRDQGALHRISFVGGSVTADSVTPASGSGSTQTFALQDLNTSGATNIATAFALFTSTASASACLAHYDRPSNTVGLLNDAGTQDVSGVVGAAGVLTNSRCTITLGSSSVTLSGERLTLNLAITFAPMFAGATSIHLYAANAAGANSGWQMRGAWTVPSGPAAVVTADSVTPASGSGASQMFALRFSDTAGATDSSGWRGSGSPRRLHRAR